MQVLTKAERTSIQSVIQRTALVYGSKGPRNAWLRLPLHLSDAGYEAIHTLKIRPSSQLQSITVVITVFGHNGTDLHQNSMDLCDTHIPIHPQNHPVFPSAGSSSVSPPHSMKDTVKMLPRCTIASRDASVNTQLCKYTTEGNNLRSFLCVNV